MKGKHVLLATFSLLMLTGMRDPFQQPEDHCHTGELAQWRYQGMVGKGGRNIGLLQDGQQRWRRVEQNQILDNGWRIAQLNAQTIVVNTGAACEPAQWQWQRQGKANETMDSGGAVGDVAPGTGRKSAERDAYAG